MIESNKNQQVKNLTALIKKNKERKSQGVYVVEGPRMFYEAPKSDLVKAYLSQTFYEKMEDKNILDGMDMEILRDDVYEYVSDTKTPQGVMCIMKQKGYKVSDIIESTVSGDCEKKPQFLMLIENLQDPGNLGTIIRAAEGAGVSGVIMSPNTVDIYNPKTIRSTMGAIYRVPFAYAEDFNASMSMVKSAGIKIYAAHLRGQKSYDECELDKPTAFIIGNEGNGITDETARAADELVIIPMLGKVESLNAAVAATILMYETARQRR